MHSFNLSVLFLAATMPLWLGIIVAVLALVIGVGLTFVLIKAITDKENGGEEAPAEA